MEFTVGNVNVKWKWIILIYLAGWFMDTVFNMYWIKVICTIIAGMLIIPKLIGFIGWFNKRVMGGGARWT